jgi:hypothetical protein
MEALKNRVKKHKIDTEKLKSEIDKLKGNILFVKSSNDMKKFAYYIYEFNEDFLIFQKFKILMHFSNH